MNSSHYLAPAMNNSKHYLVPALNNSKDYLVQSLNNSKDYLVQALNNSKDYLAQALNNSKDYLVQAPKEDVRAEFLNSDQFRLVDLRAATSPSTEEGVAATRSPESNSGAELSPV